MPRGPRQQFVPQNMPPPNFIPMYMPPPQQGFIYRPPQGQMMPGMPPGPYVMQQQQQPQQQQQYHRVPRGGMMPPQQQQVQPNVAQGGHMSPAQTGTSPAQAPGGAPMATTASTPQFAKREKKKIKIVDPSTKKEKNFEKPAPASPSVMGTKPATEEPTANPAATTTTTSNIDTNGSTTDQQQPTAVRTSKAVEIKKPPAKNGASSDNSTTTTTGGDKPAPAPASAPAATTIIKPKDKKKLLAKKRKEKEAGGGNDLLDAYMESPSEGQTKAAEALPTRKAVVNNIIPSGKPEQEEEEDEVVADDWEAEEAGDNEGGDSAVSANAALAPKPGNDQWTPTFPTGKKSYSANFLMAFQKVCKDPPKTEWRQDLDEVFEPVPKKAVNSSSNFMSGTDFRGGNPRFGSGKGRQDFRGGGNRRNSNFQSGGNSRGGSGERVINLPTKEPIKLHTTENAFVPSMKKTDSDEPEQTTKTRLKQALSILNKLTLEKFDRLSDQLVNLLVSDKELLEDFVAAIFAKAIDEAFFSSIYAKLCKKIIAESELKEFRKILLNKCQENFEAATRAEAEAKIKDKEKKVRSEKEKEEELKGLTEEERLKKREEELEEEYQRNKVKRHMLGNIQFIAELFKEEMVNVKIFTHCVNELMPDKTADEENMECLCKLLDTAGGKFEKLMGKKGEEGRNTLDVTFQLMHDISRRKDVSARIRFAIKDILDMRQRRWKPRTEKKGPKTIDQIHEEAKNEQLQIQQNVKNAGGQHGGRRGSKNQYGGGGGSGGGGGHHNQPRKEKLDTSRFQLGNMDTLSLGPKGKSFGGGGNRFAGLGTGGSSPQLKPKHASGGNATLGPTKSALGSLKGRKSGASSPSGTGTTTPPVQSELKLSKAELDKKCKGVLKEYLSTHDVGEVRHYIREWGHPDATLQFAETIFSELIEAKLNQHSLFEKLAFGLTSKSSGNDGIPATTFQTAFLNSVKTLPVVLEDAPEAYDYFAKVFAAGCGADRSCVQCLRKLTSDELSKNSDMKQLQEECPEVPLKLVFSVFKAYKRVKKVEGAHELFKYLDTPLSKFLDNADRVEALADRRDVMFLLYPPMEEVFNGSLTNDKVIEVVDKAHGRATGDPGFSGLLVQDVVKAIAKATTCKTPEDAQKEPTEKSCEEEKKMFEDRSEVLKKYAATSDAKLHLICGVQQATTVTLKNPIGLCQRIFMYLYETDLVSAEDFEDWFKDSNVSEKKYSDKQIAKIAYQPLREQLTSD